MKVEKKKRNRVAKQKYPNSFLSHIRIIASDHDILALQYCVELSLPGTGVSRNQIIFPTCAVYSAFISGVVRAVRASWHSAFIATCNSERGQYVRGQEV